MHLNKCFMYSGTPEKIVPSVTKVENDLKGYMHMLVISAKGNPFIMYDRRHILWITYNVIYVLALPCFFLTQRNLFWVMIGGTVSCKLKG